MRLLVLSDVHYACDAEKARRGHEGRAAGSRVLATAAKLWRHFVWLRDPLAHNHRLDQILAAEPNPDVVVANGDYSLDTAFVGVSDPAAGESAAWVLARLSSAYGDRLSATIGDHELGKMSLFGGVGGPRWASWRRCVDELGLQPVWRRDVGRYSLVGAPSTALSTSLYQPEFLPSEAPLWEKLHAETTAELARTLDGVERGRRILLFVHDPSALAFLGRRPDITAHLDRVERTFVGHLHSKAMFRLASSLSGAPRVTGLGQTLRRYTLALREARAWRLFKAELCPSPNGIQLLKDGGYLTVDLDPEARRPATVRAVRLPW